MIMDYIYPAVFNANDDGSYTITFPDLPGCISEGKSLSNALYMAENALQQWIENLTGTEQPIPLSSNIQTITAPISGLVTLVRTEIKDNHAVRRTISLPSWMDQEVSNRGWSLSRILQDELKSRLN
jgi:predicted RNase H-like HicB family nuclease